MITYRKIRAEWWRFPVRWTMVPLFCRALRPQQFRRGNGLAGHAVCLTKGKNETRRISLRSPPNAPP